VRFLEIISTLLNWWALTKYAQTEKERKKEIKEENEKETKCCRYRKYLFVS
jgi:hypothetical protein